MAEIIWKLASKPWWQSKTIWVNGLTLIAAILSETYGPVPLSPETAAIVLAIVNLVLRVVTWQPIDSGPE